MFNETMPQFIEFMDMHAPHGTKLALAMTEGDLASARGSDKGSDRSSDKDSDKRGDVTGAAEQAAETSPSFRADKVLALG